LLTAVLCWRGLRSGLSNSWWNAFLDPTEPGNYRDNIVFDIQRSISFRDTRWVLSAPRTQARRPGPGRPRIPDRARDTLQIQMLDFVQLGTETGLSPVVDELGNLDLPQIGVIRAEGRTARELRADIIQKAKSLGIYNPEEEPTVTITVANPLQRICTTSRAASCTPGPTAFPSPIFG